MTQRNISSDEWKKLPWKKFRRTIFRLQKRIYKAQRNSNHRLVRKLQRLILNSRSAWYLAVRQVTQLNQGKKTAGIDGKLALRPQERIEIAQKLSQWKTWRHKGLKAIPIPKKDGSQRILKIPCIEDRAYQKLLHYALDPAHEATFHARSYGFRPGRSTQDAQKILYLNLNSNVKGLEKRILEIDIEKCFDRINHQDLMKRVILPSSAKIGLWRTLKGGVNPEFPEQGTPQGGNISPTLANIALNGIENIHKSVRYADDMVYLLKPEDDATKILATVEEFLAQRGLQVKAAKTHLTASTDGFDFLGWHFKVLANGRFKSYPSQENYRAFLKKVKRIVNSSHINAKDKAKKLAPVIRGWRNYHKSCDMKKFNLWYTHHRAWKVFNREKKQTRTSVNALIHKAFPTVPWRENRYINVIGDKSPYDGDLLYWSERNAKQYDNFTAKAIKRQNFRCGDCGLRFIGEEPIELHHKDGQHGNWRGNNLVALHRSCHQYQGVHRANTEVKTC